MQEKETNMIFPKYIRELNTFDNNWVMYRDMYNACYVIRFVTNCRKYMLKCPVFYEAATFEDIIVTMSSMEKIMFGSFYDHGNGD